MPSSINRSLNGTTLKVRVDYAARDVQMVYAVSIPDPDRKVVEENAEASIGMLPELLRRVASQRNEVSRLV